jgi:hypothetical protein
MVNFAYQSLGYVVADREKLIANFNSVQKALLEDVDYAVMHILTGDDFMYRNWMQRGDTVVGNPKDYFVDTFLEEDNKEPWFFIYSITQEKEILEKIFERTSPEEVSLRARGNILRNLYRANHLGLAKRFEDKFSVNINLESILSCLSDYYFNTGDERGLHESLLSLGGSVMSRSLTLNWRRLLLCSIGNKPLYK